MRKFRTRPILIFIAVLVVLYCVIYVVPTVTGALRSSYTVGYGQLLTMDQTEGYIVRNENVYIADTSGTANRYIKEGKLIRKGTRIMEVIEEADPEQEQSTGQTDGQTGGQAAGQTDGHPAEQEEIQLAEGEILTDTYTAESEGILTYHMDGLESNLTPANMKEKSTGYFRRLSSASRSLKTTTVTRGDPVFKIVDRSGWYLVCFVPKTHQERYSKGQKVSLYVGEEQIMGTIRGVKVKGRKCRLIIRSDYYFDGFLTERKCDLKVVTSDVMGLLIDNSSITKKKGQTGVYVRQKTGEYQFTPISVYATDGEKSAIAEGYFFDEEGNPVNTVKNYDEVLRRP